MVWCGKFSKCIKVYIVIDYSFMSMSTYRINYILHRTHYAKF